MSRSITTQRLEKLWFASSALCGDYMAPFGFFGPVTFQTRKGTRVTFVAGLVTIPLTAFSVYQLLSRTEKRPESTHGEHAPSSHAREVDLSDR